MQKIIPDCLSVKLKNINNLLTFPSTFSCIKNSVLDYLEACCNSDLCRSNRALAHSSTACTQVSLSEVFFLFSKSAWN